MNVQQSLVLGVIQGLTEFIPISSTAHLILAPQVLNVAPPRAAIAHTYDTVIQIGTVLPVLVYFWRDWLKLLSAALRIIRHLGPSDDPDERMVIYLLLGSIPAGVVGLVAEKYIERLANPAEFPPAFLLIGASMIIVGLIMWWAELTSRKIRTIENVGPSDSLIVGCAQALALIPGVSRSGSTITAGLLTGMTREAAARFSFLLMTPIMLAATGYKTIKLFRGSEVIEAAEWQGMLLATVVAAITGYAAIAFLLGWLRKRSLGVFAVYRILVGAFSIGLYFMQQPGAVNRSAAPPAIPAKIAVAQPQVQAEPAIESYGTMLGAHSLTGGRVP
ncbi:MAG: undecaprenyl-diphosphatase UppP [Actinomycetota bacterium]